MRLCQNSFEFFNRVFAILTYFLQNNNYNMSYARNNAQRIRIAFCLRS